jgi:hypothetical protein
LYTTKPTGSFTQFDVIPANELNIGSGATFDVRYTSIVDQEVFLADGIGGTYVLKTAPIDIASMMVVVNGDMVSSDDIALNGNSFTIPTPNYGANVAVTVFNTPQYSTAIDSEITATIDATTNHINTNYKLLRSASNTVPDYSTAVVSVNGKVLPPPTIDTYVSNGYSRIFPLTYQPTNFAFLSVYVDGVIQVKDVDYTVADQTVILNYDAAIDAIVVLVVTDPDYGYYYTFNGDEIIFEDIVDDGFDDLGFDNIFGFDFDDGIIKANDRISVTNFSQDLSYRFATEQFVGNSSGQYELAGVPTAESTLTVMINGVVQRMLWDYALATEYLEGFDTQGYDLNAFDEGRETKYYVRFNENLRQNDQDTIIVRYMRGKTERPATAFRQFIGAAGNNTSQVLSAASKTLLLSNVYVYSNEIEVSDVTVLTAPTVVKSGVAWINDEKIRFSKLLKAPSSQYPNRGFISDLARGNDGTNSSPLSTYQAAFSDGDGVTAIFVIPTELLGKDITVWIDNALKAAGHHYQIVDGSVVFAVGNIPPVGYKNIRMSSLVIDRAATLLCHEMGAAVQDGGSAVSIPGGYKWESAIDGLQYSSSDMSRFILEHPGTRS